MSIPPSVYGRALVEQSRIAGNVLYGRAKERLDAAWRVNERPTEGILAVIDGASQVLEIYRSQLLFTDPYYCPPDLCELLEAQVPTLSEWVIATKKLPADKGFIWFDEHIPLPPTPKTIDHYQGHVSLAAIGWTILAYKYIPTAPRSILYVGDTYDGADSLWLVVSMFVHHAGQVEPALQMSFLDGETLSTFLETDKVPPDRMDEQNWGITSLRYLATLISLMEKGTITSEAGRPDRATRKRLPPFVNPNTVIQVLNLRSDTCVKKPTTRS